MKFALAILLSAVAALLLPAHAENNAAGTTAPASGLTKGRGALYQIQHEGRTAWLFGTVHVGRPEFAPLGGAVERALAQADRLVLELDIRDNAPLQRAMGKYGLYQEGDGIERHVAADTLAQLQRTLAGFGIELANVRRMRPWMVANLLMGLDLDRNGYHRQYAAEYILLAGAAGKPVRELETVEYQMSLFDGMDDALQEVYLREALAELESGQALSKARVLIETWAAADRVTLEAHCRAMLEEETKTAEFTRRVLLGERNPGMANKVEALLREEGSSFVGVGMLHLLGEDGLPALLRQRGYRVERVY